LVTSLDVLRSRVTRDASGILRVTTRVVVVLEGEARAATTERRWANVVAADGSGDDTLVLEARRLLAESAHPLLVTADRALRARAGVDSVGPSWLLDLVSTSSA
jgi:hypothetical protein